MRRGTRVTWISEGETCTTVAPNGAPTIPVDIVREDVPCFASFMSIRRFRSAAIMRRRNAERPRTRTCTEVGTSPEISSCEGMLVNSSGTWKPTSANGSEV